MNLVLINSHNKWFGEKGNNLKVSRIHKYKETYSIHFVQSSLKSHLLCVTLYTKVRNKVPKMWKRILSSIKIFHTIEMYSQPYFIKAKIFCFFKIVSKNFLTLTSKKKDSLINNKVFLKGNYFSLNCSCFLITIGSLMKHWRNLSRNRVMRFIL